MFPCPTIVYRPNLSSQSLDCGSFCYDSGTSLVIGGFGLRVSLWTLGQILGLLAA